MATIPPTPRTNLITVGAASAGPFLVGFRLFEADALRVFVNGSLSTAYTLSANFLNGYDDNATITFNATQPTSTKIQIDGFMTPQRQADYLNGPGLVDLLNIEFARLWAVISEDRMLLKRAVLGLSDVGTGDVADAGNRRIKNLGAPIENNDALRAVDVQNILAGGGNVPSPLVGQIGHLLQATGTGVFGWVSRAVALGAALEAVRALTPAADKLPYFTGTNAAALADFTAVARALLAAADQAAARVAISAQQQNARLDQIAGLGNPSSGQVLGHGGGGAVGWNGQMMLADQKAAGTHGGTFTAGSFVRRDLNTVRHNSITGASLAGNQITLPAGEYVLFAEVPAFAVGGHQADVYNATAAVVIERGSTGQAPSPVQTDSRIRSKFTLAVPSLIEIRHRCATTTATWGMGAALGFASEVYTTVNIIKIG